MAGLVAKIQHKLTQRRVKSASTTLPRGEYYYVTGDDKIPHKPLMRIHGQDSVDSSDQPSSNGVTHTQSNIHNVKRPWKKPPAPRPASSCSVMKFSFSDAPFSSEKAKSNAQCDPNYAKVNFTKVDKRGSLDNPSRGQRGSSDSHSRSRLPSDTSSYDSEVFEIPYESDSDIKTMNNVRVAGNRNSIADASFLFHTNSYSDFDTTSSIVKSHSTVSSMAARINRRKREKFTPANNVITKSVSEINLPTMFQDNRCFANPKSPDINIPSSIEEDQPIPDLNRAHANTLKANHRINKGNDWSEKPVDMWTNSDVINWVIHIGMDQLVEPLKGSGLRGVHMSELTEDSLVTLGLTDHRSQQQFVTELSGVLSRPLSLWSLQQASLKRQDLEKSTDVLFADLESIQKMNDVQEKLISTSMKELKMEQEVAEELLRRDVADELLQTDIADDDSDIEQLANEADCYSKQMTQNIESWTCGEVVRWLRMNELDEFIYFFEEYAVKGVDIMDANFKFLDNLENFTTGQKEALYSAVYTLITPKTRNTTANDLRKISSQDDKQKYFAAMHVAKSPTPDDSVNHLSVYAPVDTSECEVMSIGEKDVNTARSVDSGSPIYADVIDYIPLDPTLPTSPTDHSSPQVRTPVHSLYNQLGREHDYCIHCVCVPVKNNRINFHVNVPEKGHVIVATSNVKLRLNKDDRILEVCGERVFDVSLPDVFYDMIKDKTLLQLVILRSRAKKNSDKDELRVLQNKLDVSEQHWESLRHILQEMREEEIDVDEIPTPPHRHNRSFNNLQKEKDQLEEALSNNLDKVSNLQEALELKNRAIRMESDEKRVLERRLDRMVAVIASNSLNGTSVKDCETNDIWNRLQSSTKDDTLKTLRETIMSSGKQKTYLDQLLAIVIDKSPWLLRELHDDVANENVIHQVIGEEWC